VSDRSEELAFPRKEEPVLAGFELTPTAPLGEKQRQRDQESRRSYCVIPAAPTELSAVAFAATITPAGHARRSLFFSRRRTPRYRNGDITVVRIEPDLRGGARSDSLMSRSWSPPGRSECFAASNRPGVADLLCGAEEPLGAKTGGPPFMPTFRLCRLAR